MKKKLNEILLNSQRFQLNAVALGLATSLASVTALSAPVLIERPNLFEVGDSAEAGRSVAQEGRYTLLGAYKLNSSDFDTAGQAFLFEDGAQLLQTFEPLGEVGLTLYKPDPTSSGHYVSDITCTILNPAGAEAGQLVAMSEEWVVLGADSLGAPRQGRLGKDAYNDCGRGVPSVFLWRRNSNESFNQFVPYLNFSGDQYSLSVPPAPTGVEPLRTTNAKSLAVSDNDLIMGTDYGVHVFSFESNQWVYKQTFLHAQVGGNFNGAGFQVAISDDRMVVGDGTGGAIYLYKKLNTGQWEHVLDYPSSGSAGAGFGSSVDIDGRRIIVGQNVGGSGAVQFLTINNFNGSNPSVSVDGPRLTRFVPLSVAIDGDKAIAGGTYASTGNDEVTALYERVNSVWTDTQKNMAARADFTNRAGLLAEVDEVAISGSRVIAGWRGWDSNDADAVGAVIVNSFDSEPLSLPSLDNAEGAMLWDNGAEFNWARLSGSTPSSSTGPSSGSGGSGSYYYVETSSAGGGAFNKGDVAILESGAFNATNTSFSFDYHSYGANVGQLYLDVLVDGQWRVNFWNSASQNTGTQWQSHTFNSSTLGAGGALSHINPDNKPISLRFRLVAAGGWQGDVALDNLSITVN